MSDSESHEDDEQVFIRLVTRLDDYRVAVDKLQVPKKLRRIGLSQLVNHLLGTQENPMPFDFLIKNTFLRTSLKTHLKKHLLNEEDVIEIEYVFAISAPDTVDELPHEDWVSALDHHQSAHRLHVIASGSYDNIIRLWEASEEDEPRSKSEQSVLNKKEERLLAEVKGHTGPIKSLAQGKKQATVSHVTNLVGHTGPVTDCDFSSDGQLIISAGWDQKIKLWTLPKSTELDKYTIVDGETSGNEQTGGLKKKRRVEPTSATLETNRRAVESFSEHTGPIAAVRFTSLEEMVSASWDHTIKFWDIQSGIVTSTIIAKDALQCVSYNSETQLTLTGHSDGTVRLWDRRAQHAEVATMFQSHPIWVSAVSFHPSRPNVFSSASYDQSLKLWDTRAKTPLSTVSKHADKVLCSEWVDDSLLLSGSADKTLQAHLLK